MIMSITSDGQMVLVYEEEMFGEEKEAHRIIWAYDSSGVQSKKMYGSLYEPILMINKNKKAAYTFNYRDILVEAKTGAKRKLIDYRKNPPQPYSTEKVPGNVWDFSRVRFKMDLSVDSSKLRKSTTTTSTFWI